VRVLSPCPEGHGDRTRTLNLHPRPLERCDGPRAGPILDAGMRLGFIGPCRGDVGAMRPLAELLLFELDVARAVYLGADDALDRAIKGWPERFGAPSDEAAFLTEAALLAPDAPP